MHVPILRDGEAREGRAIDLDQPSGELIFLSSADSDLSSAARAYDVLLAEGERLPSLRLANVGRLSHSLSVDLYVDKTARHARMIAARLLGGASYWRYGVDRLREVCEASGAPLVLLSGEARDDDELRRLSTLDPETRSRLRLYLSHGGDANMRGFLLSCRRLLGGGDADADVADPEPMPAAGIYAPNGAKGAKGAKRAISRGGGADAPRAAILFYRAFLEGGGSPPIDRLAASLEARGFETVSVFVAGLKDERSIPAAREILRSFGPSILLNATGFALSGGGNDPDANFLREFDCPILQTILCSRSKEAWRGDLRGLSPSDLAMHVALPELDGRLITRPISFKRDDVEHPPTRSRIAVYEDDADRCDFTARLARGWARLRTRPAEELRVAVVLGNYPNRDGRIGNGVGYDAPASTIAILNALRDHGCRVDDASDDASAAPSDSRALMEALLRGPTNRLDAGRKASKTSACRLSLDAYRESFAAMDSEARDAIEGRWGDPADDPFVSEGEFSLPILTFGNAAIGIQPARGYSIDARRDVHDPHLPPPHAYAAFYVWLREVFGADAIVHNGKHGTAEWLPGKGTALSASCMPEAITGAIPSVYPFILNDPGEGAQAKRRTASTIIDHLPPPLARAESYGVHAELETLLDERAQAVDLDPRRAEILRERILELSRSSGVDDDAPDLDSAFDSALDPSLEPRERDDDDVELERLDAYLCDLKELQIRDGLHTLGVAPSGDRLHSTVAACVRLPRSPGEGGDESLPRALARDLDLRDATGAPLDPLTADLGAPLSASAIGEGGEVLLDQSDDSARIVGDWVERLELLGASLIAGRSAPRESWRATREVLDGGARRIASDLSRSGAAEIDGLLRALSGRFVPPGPSGAPTRGRPDVLPSGRNFHSLDSRALPTPSAWRLGRASADAIAARHFHEVGRWPKSLGLSAWGTSNMRTGGDDIAQAMAFMGAKPTWSADGARAIGFEILSVESLGRPRIDVTLRASGFFRDAFPWQIGLLDRAARAIGALDEPPSDNPLAESMSLETERLVSEGESSESARRIAGSRIFSSAPGAYGTGLQAAIDESVWTSREELARIYLAWGAHAYGELESGESRPEAFARRMASLEGVVHNQDNREHDVLDSDDYYQFEGGMSAAAEIASGGRRSPIYHADHSRPFAPKARTLAEEIGRVVRARAANPKWISGVMRHGYKGAFEIAATADYLFAFASVTDAVADRHFQMLWDAYIEDDRVREFLSDVNPDALREMTSRFREAIDRGLWTPRVNSVYRRLDGETDAI